MMERQCNFLVLIYLYSLFNNYQVIESVNKEHGWNVDLNKGKVSFLDAALCLNATIHNFCWISNA
jgi:hypothetical protein